MITVAAHIESLSEMRLVHGLTSSAFIQLYVNELADTLHVFNIECKHGGNITLTFVRQQNKHRSRKYPRSNGAKCPFAFIVEKTRDSHFPCNPKFHIKSSFSNLTSSFRQFPLGVGVGSVYSVDSNCLILCLRIFLDFVGFEDWNVLPPNQAGCSGHSVYCRQGQTKGGTEDQ